VIEKAGGESYEAALKRRILEPLDMRDTGIFHRGVVLVNGARGYHRDARGRFISAQDLHESWMYAAGAIYSTVDDLAKFSDALARERLVSKAALERMWQPEKGSYGLGWQTPAVSARTFNRRAVEHGGRVPGFSAYLRRFVDDGLTIVVLSNRFDTQPERVASSLSAAVFGESYQSVFDRKPIDLATEVRRRYLGDYELDGARFTLFERDGALFARSDDWPEVRVFAENDDELFVPGMEDSAFAVENNAGQLTGLMISTGGAPKIARKVR
jgi:CubicO group peptidase (beta-lactamase class C family)